MKITNEIKRAMVEVMRGFEERSEAEFFYLVGIEVERRRWEAHKKKYWVKRK